MQTTTAPPQPFGQPGLFQHPAYDTDPEDMSRAVALAQRTAGRSGAAGEGMSRAGAREQRRGPIRFRLEHTDDDDRHVVILRSSCRESIGARDETFDRLTGQQTIT